MHILVVEDDEVIRDALDSMVKIMGHEGSSATTVKEGLVKARAQRPALIVLDYNLPDGSASDFLAGLRAEKTTKTPSVIMLTSDVSLTTKLQMFEMGVQDYVCKPFEMRELMARIRVVSERPSQRPTIKVGTSIYDEVEKVLRADDASVSLTQNEDRLFRALAAIDEPMPKTELYKQIWGERRVGPRNLDTLVNYLRKKIEPMGLEIKAVYGVGYKLEAGTATAKPSRPRK